ncbi:hypothetical protein CLOP_g19878 [Closterium sp. NIES-67]|nr:hypothetical protein CLOP_g19878 [Closterium sp. NIES-67]
MKTHRKDDDFAQGLANMMKTKDWSKSYPNLMRMWQALAVLPLSTVECERGFSRQNHAGLRHGLPPDRGEVEAH